MIYGTDEVPVEATPDGIIKISRTDEELFNARVFGSINGKPVVNDHPPEDVNPSTWKELAIGSAFNPRRGTGINDDLLICDLLITDADGIRAVNDDKREISLGYDANYVETGKGEGYQKDIFINHIALVESGRCGLRCAIGDSKPTKTGKETSMGTKTARRKLLDHAIASKDDDMIDAALALKDEDEEEKLKGNDKTKDDDESENETHVHLHTGGPAGSETFDSEDFEAMKAQNEKDHAEFRKRLDALEGKKTADSEETEEEKKTREEKEAKDKTKDDEEEKLTKDMEEEVPEDKKKEAMKARDSAYLQDSYSSTIALAEILVPGISFKTFDRSAKPTETTKAICALRKKTLDLAYHQPATRDILDDLLNGKPISCLAGMSCSATRTLFNAAASVRKTRNNDSQHQSGIGRVAHSGAKGITSIADLNKKSAEFWKDRI